MLPEAESGGRSESVAVRGSTYLLGYATTETRAYVPGASRVALLMRTDVAFAPLRRLMWTLLGLFVLLGAGAASVAVFWANQYSLSAKLRDLIQQIQQAGIKKRTLLLFPLCPSVVKIFVEGRE